jgi:hypothetical protein
MLPMEKSVTFTGACANEIIPNGRLARLLAKRKKEVMLELKLDLTRVMLMLDSIVCVVVWIDSHLSI